MSDPKIGEFLSPEDKPLRDAIHVAIIPMIAGDNLNPGQKVRLKRGSENIALAADYNETNSKTPRPGECIGVVDPFMNDYFVSKGKMFYVFLTPGTITGMRHHWEHPVFDMDDTPNDDHEAWLMEFAEKYNFDYNDMLQTAKEAPDGSSWGRYVVARGVDLHGAQDLDPGEEDEFWRHMEGLTGATYDEKHREDFGWSCSC